MGHPLSGLRYNLTSGPPYLGFFYQSGSLLAPATSYTGVGAARTGGNAIVARGLSTAAVVAAGLPVYEDRGDGLTFGVWTFPGFTNDASTDFATWTATGTMVRTASVAGAPDGTATAYTINDTDAALASKLSVSLGNGQRSFSVWVRDNATAPTSPGALMGGGSVGAGFGSGASWRRVSAVPTANNASLIVYPAGAATPGPTLTTAATGAVDVWMPSSVSFGLSPSFIGTADYPAIVGTTGAATLQLKNMNLVDTGDLDFSVASVRMSGSVDLYSLADVYVFAGASPEGLIALRYTQTGGTSPSWILTVRGADVLTIPYAGFVVGDDVAFRVWYRISTGQAGIAMTINGCTRIVTAATTGSALADTYSAWIGSNLGVSGHSLALWQSWQARFKADVPIALTPEFVILGDSISTGSHWTNSPGANIYSKTTQRRTRPGVVSLGISGDVVSGQKGQWDASAYKGQTNVKAVIIQCGTNDIGLLHSSAATLIAAYQGLVNDIAAANPSARIFASGIAPRRASLSVPDYATWQSVNVAIGGGGGTPITGVVPVMSHVATMNDGSDNLAAAYDSGDGLHPNQLGRVVTGLAWRAALIAQGLLS